MRSSRHSRPQARYAQGATRNRPWGFRNADSAPRNRRNGLKPPVLQSGPGPSRKVYLSTPLRERGVTAVTVSERGPGKSGSPIPRRPLGSDASSYGGATVPPRPGLPCRASRAASDNPSRARDPWLSHPRPPLPRAAESLPTPLGPLGTAFPWPQGRIPSACYFPAPTTDHRSRTTICEDGRSGRSVGVMRGWSEKSQILGPRYPSTPAPGSISIIATC